MGSTVDSCPTSPGLGDDVEVGVQVFHDDGNSQSNDCASYYGTGSENFGGPLAYVAAPSDAPTHLPTHSPSSTHSPTHSPTHTPTGATVTYTADGGCQVCSSEICTNSSHPTSVTDSTEWSPTSTIDAGATQANTCTSITEYATCPDSAAVESSSPVSLIRCPATWVSAIYFPATLGATIISRPCYSSRARGVGSVRWQCLPDGTWNYSSWDSSGCRSEDSTSLEVLADTQATSNDEFWASLNGGVRMVINMLQNRSVLKMGTTDANAVGSWISSWLQRSSSSSIGQLSSPGVCLSRILSSALIRLVEASQILNARASRPRDDVPGGVIGSVNLQVHISGATYRIPAESVAQNVRRRLDAIDTNLRWSVIALERNGSVLSTCSVMDITQVYLLEVEVYYVPRRGHSDDTGNPPYLDIFQLTHTLESFDLIHDMPGILQSSLTHFSNNVTIIGNPSTTMIISQTQPLVGNFGPLLSAIAALALNPGESVRVRGARINAQIRSDSCSRLTSSVLAEDIILGGPSQRTNASDGPMLNCRGDPWYHVDNTYGGLRLNDDAILSALGFSVLSVNRATAEARPHLIEEVHISPLTLQRLYSCSSRPLNYTNGQSIVVYRQQEFMSLINGSVGANSENAEVFAPYQPANQQSDVVTAQLRSTVVSLTLSDSPDTWPNTPTLNPPVNITFRDVDSSPSETKVCAFWSFSDRAFKTEGCTTFELNDTVVICTCNHTTNFAVLTSVDGSANNDVSASDRSPNQEHSTALSIIMYIALAVSLTCFAIVLLTYLCNRKLLVLGKKILCHICATLAVGETAFVVGVILAVESDPSVGVCTTLGVLAHYFLLAAFGWMVCDASFIHSNFTSVFQSFTRDERQSMMRYTVLSYGVPLFVVVVTAVAVPGAYDSADDGHCFLTHREGAIWAFVGPMIAALLVNMVLLVQIVRAVKATSVRKLSSMDADAHAKHEARVRAKRAVHASMSFFFLLGIGWLFGVFAVGDISLVFQYIFSCFLLLHGACLAYFHCFIDPDARVVWINWVGYITDKTRRGSSEFSSGRVVRRRDVESLRSTPNHMSLNMPVYAAGISSTSKSSGSTETVFAPNGASTRTESNASSYKYLEIQALDSKSERSNSLSHERFPRPTGHSGRSIFDADVVNSSLRRSAKVQAVELVADTPDVGVPASALPVEDTHAQGRTEIDANAYVATEFVGNTAQQDNNTYSI